MALQYRCIARVAKTHGTKGEVVAVPANGLPLVLSEGMTVALVPPLLRKDRWHTVLDVETSDAGQLVTLSDVENQNDAHELVGSYILVNADELDGVNFDDDFDDLIGVEVIDERLGLLGTVKEILFGTAQDILVVEGERGQTLIPFVDELVNVPEEGPIQTTIPVGLAPWDTGIQE